MERGILEKPSVVKEMLISKCIWSGIFLFVGLVLLTYSVTQCVRFRNVEKCSVRLESVISRVEEGTDADGYDEYYVYVTYDYNGKTYTKKHLTSTKEAWLDRVGETITIRINPDKPTEELNDIQDSIWLGFFFGIPAMAVGITFCFRMRCRLSWVEMYGMRDSAIRKDLKEAAKQSRRYPFLLSLGIGYIAAGIYVLDVDSVGAADILLGLMILGLYCMFRFLFFKKEKCTGEGAYHTFKSRVLDKKVERDSDGDNEYYLQTGDGRWSRCSQRKYEILPIGAEITEIVCGILRLEYWYDRENGSHWML